MRDDEKEAGGSRWGLLSVLSVTSLEAAELVPHEAHALFLGKIPWLGAMTTRPSEAPKMGKKSSLKRIVVIFPLKSQGW